MSYKIAIASSDGISIDESFGSAKGFHIFEVTEDGYSKAEFREAVEPLNDSNEKEKQEAKTSGEEDIGSAAKCSSEGCHGGAGGGCSGNGEVSWKVELISDCRCIVCKKIGFHVQKQLERRAITSFDVECAVEDALTRISFYFQKVDNHQSLRGNK